MGSVYIGRFFNLISDISCGLGLWFLFSFFEKLVCYIVFIIGFFIRLCMIFYSGG